MTELRCANDILFGVLEDGIIEVKCRSRRCGAKTPGVVVLHRFDALTGEPLDTKRFKDPAQMKEGRKANASGGSRTAVRSS